MNNLLIVDDEKEILECLEELFRYEFDKEIDVYTAGSAFEALEVLNKIKFDVVLSDIKMPGMDGIQLYKEIKKNWPSCRVVFLSAYRSFDYMYKLCSENHDIQYVLKSEDDEVIMGAVRNAFQDIDVMLRQRMEADEQKILLERAKAKMQQETLYRLIYQIAGKEISQEQLDKIDLNINLKYPVMSLLIRLNEISDTQDPENLFVQVLALINNFSPDEIGFYNCVLNNKYAVVLVQPHKVNKINWKRIFVVVNGAVEYAQENFQEVYQSSFSAIISSSEVMIHEMHSKISWLREIAIGCLSSNEPLIAHAETLQLADTVEVDFQINNHIESIKQNLKLRKREEYFKELSICCARLAGYSSKHDLEALSLYYGMAVVILQFINDNGMNQELAFQIGLYKLLETSEHNTWNDAGQYLFDLSEKIFGILGVTDDNLSSQAMNRLLHYIDEHLADDLTLVRLAEVSGFNASYLSRLFKKIKDIAISGYILDKRMNMAQRLLRNTNEKVNAISSKTGYLSAHSFTRAFRNYTGVSPQEYRERTSKFEK